MRRYSDLWISWKGSSTGIVLSGVYRRAWRNANSVGAGVRFVEANTLSPHEWHSCRTGAEGLGSPGRRLWTARRRQRSDEHTAELQSIMRTSYAVFCLKQTQTHIRG